MCRFISYTGKHAILLEELLVKPENSLIHQSREAREGRIGLNGDGFGVAWYDHTVDDKPGAFRSIQPAWNDRNLKHLAAKIKSKLFLAHVRASTVGDVGLNNCHPFNYDKYTFVHNGTVRGFESIRRIVLNQLDDDLFAKLSSQTDSEHVFMLIMQYLKQAPEAGIEGAVKAAFAYVVALQSKQDEHHYSKLNIAISDGHQLLVTRYATKDHNALSLYYAYGKEIDESDEDQLLVEGRKKGAIIVSSEPLTAYAEEWHEVPINHYLLIKQDFNLQIKSF